MSDDIEESAEYGFGRYGTGPYGGGITASESASVTQPTATTVPETATATIATQPVATHGTIRTTEASTGVVSTTKHAKLLWESNDASVAAELDQVVQQSVAPTGADRSRVTDIAVYSASTVPTAIGHSTARSHGTSSTGRQATARDHTRAGDSPLTNTRSSTTALETTIASVLSKAISQATLDTKGTTIAVDTASTTPSTTQRSLSIGTSAESSTTHTPSRMDLLLRSGAAIAPTILSNTTLANTETTAATEQGSSAGEKASTVESHTRSAEYGTTLQFVTPTGFEQSLTTESARTTHVGRLLDPEETALSTDTPRTTSHTTPETVPELATTTEDGKKTGVVSHNVLDTTGAQSVRPYASTTSARSVVTTSTAVGYDDGSVAVHSQLALQSDVPGLSRLFQLNFLLRNDETAPMSRKEVRIESDRTDSVRILTSSHR